MVKTGFAATLPATDFGAFFAVFLAVLLAEFLAVLLAVGVAFTFCARNSMRRLPGYLLANQRSK